MSELLTSSPFFYSLAITLVHFLWQGCLIALFLKGLLLITDHSKSKLRYSYSALATLANLVIPIITFFIIYRPVINEHLMNSSFMPLLASTFSSSGTLEQSELNNWLEWLPFISFAWLICVIYLSMKLVVEFYTVKQLPKKQIVQPSDKLTYLFMSLAQKLQLSRKPQLLLSLSASVPMAIGWLKPVVLIPASMVTGLTHEQLEMLMLHELAHVQRNDYLVNLLQTLVEILLFFHPAVRWVSNQMRNEREYCSDDIAVKHCGDPIAYAHTLTDTAMLCQKHNHRTSSIPSMAMAASGGDLKKRVVRLVNHHCAQATPNQNKWLAGALILFSIIVVSSQHLITLTLLNEQAGILSLLTKNYETQPVQQSKYVPPFTIENHEHQLHNSSIAKQLLGEDKKVETKQVHFSLRKTEAAQAIVAKSITPRSNNNAIAPALNENDSVINAVP